MKKLLILMLVLGVASVSQAATVGFTVGGSSEYNGTAGETITINLIADSMCSGASLSAVAEGDSAVTANQIDMGGSIASIAGGPGFAVAGSEPGFEDNYNGALFSVFSGTAVPAIGIGNVIMTFQYTIDAAWDGSEFWVSPMVADASYEWAPSSFMNTALSYASLEVGGTPTNVGITGVHIIPEPMTIALLGLGGLVLLRRRK